MANLKQARLETSNDVADRDKEKLTRPLIGNKVQVFTIGFTKKSLREFILLLKKYKIEKVVDIRLRPYGQLAGYSNKEDLKYVLEEYEKISYQHEELLAPTKDILDDYRKNSDWGAYEKKFNELLKDRKIEDLLKSIINGFTRICLLCSEDKPDKCHRRLVVEYFSRVVPSVVEIIHITKDDLKKDTKITDLK